MAFLGAAAAAFAAFLAIFALKIKGGRKPQECKSHSRLASLSNVRNIET
jgi:hypothetical protein